MSISHKYYLEVWIGLAKVQSIKGNDSILKGANHAYVTVLGLARNKIEFKEKVKQELLGIELSLIGIEETDTFSNRIANYKVEESLYKLAEQILLSNEKVLFSTFHVYD